MYGLHPSLAEPRAVEPGSLLDQRAQCLVYQRSKPYEFIGFGAMDVTKPYEFIGFGAMDVTKPYEFIGFG